MAPINASGKPTIHLHTSTSLDGEQTASVAGDAPQAAPHPSSQPGARTPCECWIPKEGKMCRFLAVPGQRYCGNHLYEMTGLGRKRVPCPADPGHHVYEDLLAAHLKKCPSARQQRQALAAPHFWQDANARAPSAPDVVPLGPDDTCADENPFAGGRAARRQAMAACLGEDGMRALVHKVEAAHEATGAGLWQKWTEVLPSFECLLEPESADPGDGSAKRPFSVKHAQQQAAILSCIERAGLTVDSDSESESDSDPASDSASAAATWVEFGAGKGYLAAALAASLPVQRLVLVDTGSFRFRAERALRKAGQVQVERVKCDVRHLDLGGVASVATARRWVGVGKHLCGACTDYTLRCCVNGTCQATPPGASPAQPQGASTAAPALDFKWQGLAVATCCHHRCSWVTYVGQPFMQCLGFTPQEFELVSWMTGWAVCGHEDPRGGPQQQPTQTAGGAPDPQVDCTAPAPATSEPGREAAPAQQQSPSSPSTDTASSGDGGLAQGKQGKQQGKQGLGGQGRAAIATAWLSREERVRVGELCKQLIDVGRAEWLREAGCEVRRVVYTDKAVTGENRLLLAAPAALVRQQ